MPIFGLKKHLILEIGPPDFLKSLTIWASFSYKLFSYEKKRIVYKTMEVHIRWNFWKMQGLGLIKTKIFCLFECVFSVSSIV